MNNIVSKYIEGSYIPANEPQTTIKLSSLIDQFLVIEEKIDGVSVSISFDSKVNITIQVHNKINDPKQFELLHTWAHDNQDSIFDLIHDRYVMYGRWCYTKQTIFYDNLCAYFIETDIYDKEDKQFISTTRKQSLISKHASSIICSAPVFKIGKLYYKNELNELLTRSFYKSNQWKEKLVDYCGKHDLNFDSVMSETDNSDLGLGLYIKSEDANSVIGRYKFLRKSLQPIPTILRPANHNPIPNILNVHEE